MFDKTQRMHDITTSSVGQFKLRDQYELCSAHAPPTLRWRVATTCYENFKPFKILVACRGKAASWEDFCTTTADIGRVLYEFTKNVGGA